MRLAGVIFWVAIVASLPGSWARASSLFLFQGLSDPDESVFLDWKRRTLIAVVIDRRCDDACIVQAHQSFSEWRRLVREKNANVEVIGIVGEENWRMAKRRLSLGLATRKIVDLGGWYHDPGERLLKKVGLSQPAAVWFFKDGREEVRRRGTGDQVDASFIGL